MVSIAFPKMFGPGKTFLVEDLKAVQQNLKLLLTSEKMELFCDPYYGDNLKRMFYEKAGILKDILIDDIYVAIQTFMPQLTVTKKNIEVYADKRDVYCRIYGLNNNNMTPSVLDINLTEFENER